MSKNYILEPVEAVLVSGQTTNIVTASNETAVQTIYDAITDGTILDISGTKLKYAGIVSNDMKAFTIDGLIPESQPQIFGTLFIGTGDAGYTNIAMASSFTGSQTVSIYTETDDGSDSDSTDISYNFAFEDHARNDIDGIDDLMDAVLCLTKSSTSTPTEQASDDEDVKPGKMPISGGDA